jgi:hypothetical protein
LPASRAVSFGDGLFLALDELLHVLAVHLVFRLLDVFEREMDSLAIRGYIQDEKSIDVLEPGGFRLAALDDSIDGSAGGGAAGALESLDDLLGLGRKRYGGSAGSKRLAARALRPGAPRGATGGRGGWNTGAHATIMMNSCRKVCKKNNHDA